MDKINKNSILAGMMIGLGVIANTFSENKYIGSLLFSLALLSIINMKLQLYTGKIGFCLEKKNTLTYYLLMLICNLLGSLITAFLAIVTLNNDEKITKFREIANYKFSRSYVTLFICGLLCGILIFVAVYCKNTVITILCIMTFILCGYEHCIADVPFLAFNFSIQNLIKEILIILGNSVGSIMAYMLVERKDAVKS